MSENATDSQDSIGTLTAAIESFTDTVTEALDTCGADADTVEAVREVGAELTGATSELETRVAETADDLGAVVEDLREEQRFRGIEDSKIRSRLHDVETRLADLVEGGAGRAADPGAGDDATGNDAGGDARAGPTPETPLERVAALPDGMVEEETANVRRAVFVARNVEEYTRSCRAGRVIESSRLRSVLVAGTDSKGHSQTVDRVMGVLEEFGGEEVEIVRHRRERKVVFSEALCRRLARLTGGPDAEAGTGAAGSHGVVTAGGT